MPCRARPAAPSVQCLWITDDLLADAYRRFVHVSRTNRRYGSNVPGPLEARRRLARRRMGMAPMASGSVPPAFDFGAIFGLNRWFPDPIETRLKYEPPTVRQEQATHPKGSVWQWLTRPARTESPWDVEESMPGSVASVRDPVAESMGAFEALLASFRTSSSLDEMSMQALLDFLQGPENVSDAQNTLRLVQWLKARTIPEQTWSAVTKMVLQKVELLSISENEISGILFELSQTLPALSWTITDIATQVAHVPSAHVSDRIVQTVTRNILRDLSDRQTTAARLDAWLCSLSASSHTLFNRPTTRIWRAIFRMIARHFRPSELPHYFGSIDQDHLVNILERHWILKGHLDLPVSVGRSRLRKGEVLPPDTVDLMPKERPSWKAFSPYVLSSGRLRQPTRKDVFAKYTSLAHGRETGKTISTCKQYKLLDLVAALQHFGLPSSNLLREVFALYQQNLSDRRFGAMFSRLQFRSIDIPQQLALDLLRDALDAGRLYLALRIFGYVPSLPLVDCLQLPLRLVDEVKISGARVWRIFTRRTSKDMVPLDQRNNSKKSLAPEILGAVYLLAYKYAKSPGISARTAFRRVWECFRFLHSHQAIEYGRPSYQSTLLSRALVEAGITRCFEERRPMSRTMTRYIISMVGKLEGEDQIQRLDKLVFELHGQYVQAAKQGARGFSSREARAWERVGRGPVNYTARHFKRRRYKEWYSDQSFEMAKEELAGASDITREMQTFLATSRADEVSSRSSRDLARPTRQAPCVSRVASPSEHTMFTPLSRETPMSTVEERAELRDVAKDGNTSRNSLKAPTLRKETHGNVDNFHGDSRAATETKPSDSRIVPRNLLDFADVYGDIMKHANRDEQQPLPARGHTADEKRMQMHSASPTNDSAMNSHVDGTWVSSIGPAKSPADSPVEEEELSSDGESAQQPQMAPETNPITIRKHFRSFSLDLLSWYERQNSVNSARFHHETGPSKEADANKWKRRFGRERYRQIQNRKKYAGS